MPYAVEFTKNAAKAFKKLPHHVQLDLEKPITRLTGNPRGCGCEKLSGEENLYRIRQGDYRIVYQIRDAVLLVLIVKLGHRRDIYR